MSGPTPEQRLVYDAVQAGKSLRQVAREQGRAESSVRKQYHRARKWFEAPSALRDGAAAVGADTPGAVVWTKTNFKGETAYSVLHTGKESPEDIAARLIEALHHVPKAPEIPAPDAADGDLLTLYPIADLHAGMFSWGEETGEDYDTDKATRRLFSWLAQCVDASPKSATAVILLNGDTLHADDNTNQTPASKHALDVDTRHHKTLEMTIAAVAGAAEYAAQKHERVIVVVLPGNHDIHAYLAVMIALAQRYRDHDRISVKNKPGEWWVHQFGKVMLSAHHGHRAKADRMVHFLADDYAPIWGRTQYRYLWTGHLHHHKAQDIGGCQWEQLRAVTARDAYAVGHAYTARAQMQAVTYHRTRGEVQRFKVGL